MLEGESSREENGWGRQVKAGRENQMKGKFRSEAWRTEYVVSGSHDFDRSSTRSNTNSQPRMSVVGVNMRSISFCYWIPRRSNYNN